VSGFKSDCWLTPWASGFGQQILKRETTRCSYLPQVRHQED
jgi:hypothetical protein